MRYAALVAASWETIDHGGRYVYLDANSPRHAVKIVKKKHLRGSEQIYQIIETEKRPDAYGRLIVYDYMNGYFDGPA